MAEPDAVIIDDEKLFNGNIKDALKARGSRFVTALPIPVQKNNPVYTPANSPENSNEDSTVVYRINPLQ